MTSWTYRKIDDKWVVGKWICERIRFDTNGNMYIYHDDPEEELISEIYEFETEWAANSHTRFCNRLENNDRIEFTTRMGVYGYPITVSTNSNSNTIAASKHYDIFRIESNGKELLRFTSNNKLDYVDVPYIIWVWLKNSLASKLLKKFWYGWA